MGQPISDNRGLLSFYWEAILRPYSWQVVWIAVLMVAAAVMQMAAIGLAVPALEVIAGGSNSGSRVIQFFKSSLAAAGFTTHDNVVILAILISASLLFVIYSGFTFANLYFSAVIGEALRREVKFKVFQQLLSAQLEIVLQRGRGSILHD